MSDNQAQGTTVRQLAFRGVFWVIFEKWTVRILGLVVFFILARLLDPVEFGIVGLAYAAVAFFGLFVDQGVGMALITRKNITRAHSDSAFYIAVIAGAVMTIIAVICAPLVAQLVDQPQVEPLMQVLAIGFVVSSLQTVPLALLNRSMDFRTQAFRRTGAAVSGAIAGVGLAAAGAGAWALVAQSLVANAVGAVVLWSATTWRPGLTGTKRAALELLKVGVRLLGLSTLSYLNEQGDALVIGGIAGPGQLGLYTVGTRFLRVILDLFTAIVLPIALPGFTRLQEDIASLQRAFLLATRLSSFAAIPLFLGLAASANIVVPFMFGEQWRASVPIMQALSFVGLVHCMTYFDRSLLLACGRSGLELRLTMVATLGNFISYVFIIPFGITGVAVALAIRNYLTWPLRIWALKQVAGIQPMTYLRHWSRPLGPSVASTAWLFAWAQHLSNAPGFFEIIGAGLAAGALYLGGCLLMTPTLLREVITLGRELFTKSVKRTRGATAPS